MINKYNANIYDCIFSNNIEMDHDLGYTSENERIEKLTSLFKSKEDEYDFWNENKYEFIDNCILDASTFDGPLIIYNSYPRMKTNTKITYLENKLEIIKKDILNYGEFDKNKFENDTSNIANIAKKEILDYAEDEGIISYKSKVYFPADNDPAYIIMYGNISANKSFIKNSYIETTMFNNQEKEYGGKKYDVFISHSSLDKEFVRKLHNSLNKLDISIFIDEKEFKWGDNWKDKLYDSIKESEFAIVVISNNFFDREWTEKELNEFMLLQKANKGQKIVLPLLYGITVNDLVNKYPTLSNIQALIYDEEKNNCDSIALSFAEQLIKRLKSNIKKL